MMLWFAKIILFCHFCKYLQFFLRPWLSTFSGGRVGGGWGSGFSLGRLPVKKSHVRNFSAEASREKISRGIFFPLVAPAENAMVRSLSPPL
ncbi:MAG: hypothetical protein K6D55_08455 [Prevotella sp.]|nr:hypothetical protein [Prevotella sp.]